MSRQQRPITDRELKAWLAAGPADCAVRERLTFVASTSAAQAGQASWMLRFRLDARFKEKVLGRDPELPLKENTKTRSSIRIPLAGPLSRKLEPIPALSPEELYSPSCAVSRLLIESLPARENLDR